MNEVRRQTLHFLRHGRFRKTSRSTPPLTATELQDTSEEEVFSSTNS